MCGGGGGGGGGVGECYVSIVERNENEVEKLPQA